MDMLGVEQKEGKMWITLKTIFGLEEVLAEELKELGFEEVELLNRAVRVEGTWRDVYFLNLHIRCAISVLVEVKKFNIKNEEDLYARCMKIKWTEYFGLDKTFAVRGAVFSDLFRHSQYPHLVVKDAIADTFRKVYDDQRPDVNVKAPQVMFDVYIRNTEVTISLNTSGLPLFQRGYREAVGLAPLNEVVAAGLIRMSGWDRKSTFVDPFCGSGTLLIEAAMMAAGIPPQLERTHFAFKNFANYQPELWEEILDAVPKRVTELPCKIIGSDISAEMVTKARRNFRGLPIGRFIETSVNSFQELTQIEGPGVMISNPPYGERMGEEVEEMYEELGDWMKGSMKGFNCWVLSSNLEAFKRVGLRPDRKIKVFNGDLECSFRKFSIYEGSKKGKYMDNDGVIPAADEVVVVDEIAIEEDPKEEFQGQIDEVVEKMRYSEDKPERPKTERKPYEKKSFGDKKPFEKRSFGDKEPFDGKRSFGDKKPFEKRSSDDKKPFKDRKSFGEKSYDKKPFDKKPFEKKSYEKKSFDKKPFEEKKPFVARDREVKRDDEIEKPARPASSKYTKKETPSSEIKPETNVEKPSAPKEVKAPKEKKEEKASKSTSASTDTKPIDSYKTRTAKDKYGRKED